MSRVVWGAAALAGAAVAFVLVARGLRPTTPDGRTAAGETASAPGAERAATDGAPGPADGEQGGDDPLHAPDALRAPDPEAVWRRHAARAVRRVAGEDLGRTLSPADEQRLVEAMARVRWAAGEGERETVDPDDPVSLARERERTETILAADATFRDVTGVGVAEFLKLLDEEQIEDLAPSPTPDAAP